MKFQLIEEIPNVNYLCTITFHRFHNKELPFQYNNRIDSFISFEKGSGRLYLHREHFEKVGEWLFNMLRNNPIFFLEQHKKVASVTERYFNFCRIFLERTFFGLSNKELSEQFQEFYSRHTENHQVGLLDVILDLYNDGFNKIISELLQKKNVLMNSNEIQNTLIAPHESSSVEKEKIDLLIVLLNIIKKNVIRSWKEHPDFIEFFRKHYDTHKWQTYMFTGPALPIDAYHQRMDKLISHPETAMKDFQNILSKINLWKDRTKIITELGLNEFETGYVQVASGVMHSKFLRKEAMIFGWYSADKMFNEIGKRLMVESRLLGFMMPEEIVDILNGKKKVNMAELEQRYQKSLIKFVEGHEEIFVGEEAASFEQEQKEKNQIDLDATEISGNTAFAGNATGKVRIVNTIKDISKVERGDILVSISTNPDLVPAMEKAAAFVTDMGGLTCHAAVVAREMRKPCVVGTKIATKVLKDNDFVEVDATAGIIKVVERHSLK